MVFIKYDVLAQANRHMQYYIVAALNTQPWDWFQRRDQSDLILRPLYLLFCPPPYLPPYLPLR